MGRSDHLLLLMLGDLGGQWCIDADGVILTYQQQPGLRLPSSTLVVMHL